MGKVAIDDTEAVLFVMELAEEIHRLEHSPASMNIGWRRTSFEKCRAERCERARGFLARLDGYPDARSGGSER